MHSVYMLRCLDGTYYVGSTSDLERRLGEHQTGFFRDYTSTRLPIDLVWSQEFPTEPEAFATERQVKGWSRAKKEALIGGDWDKLHEIVKKERKIREARK